MKGLKGAFQTDATKTSDGVWVDFPEAKNSDGTVPGFKLARLSVTNPAYAKALSDFAEETQGRTLSLEEDRAKAREIFIDNVLKDWRHIQPNDDGNALSFNRDNAVALLSDPELADLLVKLRSKASDMANYRKQQLDTNAKNS